MSRFASTWLDKSRAGRSAEKQFPQYSLQDVPADRALGRHHRSSFRDFANYLFIFFILFYFFFIFFFSPVVDYRIHLSKKIFLLESLFPFPRSRVHDRTGFFFRQNLTTNIYLFFFFYQSIVCLWRDTLKTI